MKKAIVPLGTIAFSFHNNKRRFFLQAKKETKEMYGMNCPSCGAAIADGDFFCSQCGGGVVPQFETPKNRVLILDTEYTYARLKKGIQIPMWKRWILWAILSVAVVALAIVQLVVQGKLSFSMYLAGAAIVLLPILLLLSPRFYAKRSPLLGKTVRCTFSREGISMTVVGEEDSGQSMIPYTQYKTVMIYDEVLYLNRYGAFVMADVSCMTPELQQRFLDLLATYVEGE